MELLATLDQIGVAYAKHDHPAVFTCEQAAELVPNLPAANTKNLFLRDKKGKRHLLVVVSNEKSVDLNQLSKKLELSKLSFGSAERLQKHLGVDPGSVSLLALVNDTSGSVELIVDQEIWDADALQAHPLVNTSTLVLSHQDVERFFAHTGHTPKILDVPSSERTD